VKRVFPKIIGNILRHKDAYEAKIISKVKSKLMMMLADLDEELCAGQAPANFKARIDTVYQDILGTCNYIYEFYRH
jgi:hypothetical protein